jgi:uncharacterized sulfatase
MITHRFATKGANAMSARVATFLALGALLALGLAGEVQAQTEKPARKLNVLFIAVDDLNNSLGCYGHPVVQSPNIDKLAARGMRFDRAYCQYPLCNPSRTSLLSGRRPDTTQITDNTTPPRTHLGDVVFLPEHFQKNGYYTARVGKIAHGRFEDAVKWDYSGGPARKDKDKGEQEVVQQEGGLKLTWTATNNKDEDEPDGRTARQIAKLLEQHQDQPFFLAAGFHKPHLPFVAPKKYFDLYPPEKITLPKEPPEHLKDIPPIARTHTAGDEKMTDLEKKQAIAAYYACTSFIDAQVSVLMEAMDRLKLWDNTIVVLWGDHGWHLSEHGGMWRKMSLFEESARVPLIVVTPGKKANVSSPRLVEFVDLYPTLCELCGLSTPKGMEGLSFVPLLDDPNRPWKKAAYTTVRRGKVLGHTVRTERYRYIEWGDEKTAQLYDHDKDPHEYVNLINDPKHAEVVAALRKLLKDGWKSTLPEGVKP